MEYYSTSDHSHRVGLRDAITDGIAPDGGLYMPEGIPRLPSALFNNIGAMNLRDIAYVVAHSLFHGDLPGRMLKATVAESLNFDIPLRRLGERLFGLELFHGPTMSFKDIGTRFMARLLVNMVPEMKLNVLVATSGDTGGAVANGFYRVPGVDVWVLYPTGTLDRAAEAQFAALGGNIHAVAVNADIDECREMVRSVIVDNETVRRLRLVTANSINVARLLPQTFYYFHAYAQLRRTMPGAEPPVFAVPVGNLGNLAAGVIAHRMGLPVKRFVAVNNHNDAFCQYLSTGRMDPREARHTLAEAMDVGDPSNFPRLNDLFGGDRGLMTSLISGSRVSDDEISATINRFDEGQGYLLDPHGAAACHALETSLEDGENGIFLATAHPAKFRRAVETVTGKRVEVPSHVQRLERSPRHSDRIAPHPDALRRFLASKIR